MGVAGVIAAVGLGVSGVVGIAYAHGDGSRPPNGPFTDSTCPSASATAGASPGLLVCITDVESPSGVLGSSDVPTWSQTEK